MKPVLALLLILLSLQAKAEPGARDVERVLQRDFKARGQATMDRIAQDGLQRLCTETRDRPPAALAKQVEADQ
ncbi:MAG TPA: hypothetical protein VD965_05135, partial [Burkholderiales bacterium]|nr:hypothetical protein [Burkholderiales bacterium]